MPRLWPFQPARREDAARAPEAGAARGSGAVLEWALRTTLVESRERYKDLVEISSDFVWETDGEGCFAFVSPRGALGYAAEALVGRPARDFLDGEEAAAPNPFETRERIEDCELRFRRADGEFATLLLAARPLHDQEGAWRGARGVCRDVTESRARDAALARARHGERLLAEIVAAIRDVVEPAEMLGAAAAAVSRAFAAGACRIYRHAPERGFTLAIAAGIAAPPLDLGALAEQALRASATEPFAAGGALVALARYRRQVDGALCLWREGGEWSEDERRLAAAVASQLGIAIEQIANHEALERLSFSDALTGLLNRRGFFAELARRLPRLGRVGRAGALFYVDLDNFKPVNDRFGHARGDEALCRVAELLRLGTRPGDLIGRLGGDEFALWLEGVDGEACRARAERLLALAVELAPLSGAADRPLGFSIGIAPLAPGAEVALAELTARADEAMYAVKHGGKGGFRIAAPERRRA